MKVNTERLENTRIKQQLELQLKTLEDDKERCKREWERYFEDEISSLTRDTSYKVSELSTKLLQAEARAKQVCLKCFTDTRIILSEL